MFRYEYARPAVTCDVALIFEREGTAEILLIKRRNNPFGGYWALPGGFLDEGETCESGARRELREETGIDVRDLQLVCMGDMPGRDPRGWIVSCIFCTIVEEKPIALAADDAIECNWFSLDDLPSLAFDHGCIIEKIKDFIGLKR